MNRILKRVRKVPWRLFQVVSLLRFEKPSPSKDLQRFLPYPELFWEWVSKDKQATTMQQAQEFQEPRRTFDPQEIDIPSIICVGPINGFLATPYLSKTNGRQRRNPYGKPSCPRNERKRLRKRKRRF